MSSVSVIEIQICCDKRDQRARNNYGQKTKQPANKNNTSKVRQPTIKQQLQLISIITGIMKTSDKA